MNAHVAHTEAPAPETVSTETVNPFAVTETPPKAAPDPRRKSTIVADKSLLQVKEADGTEKSFDISTLSPEIQSWCLVNGAWTFLRAFEDLAEGWAKLQAGDIPERKKAAVSVSPWKLAVAHAVVHEQKEAGVEMSLDDAITFAQKLDRKGIEQARLNPTVVYYFNALASKADKPKTSSLLDLAPAPAADAPAA